MTTASKLEVAVFSAARRLPIQERAGYLDEACAGNDGLRQRIEKLLWAGEETGTFLQGPARGAQRLMQASTVPAPPESAATPTEKVGQRIDRYKLLQQIGEGGCGVVYMAAQEEPVRRRVALKVIKLGMDTKEVIARFEAERQALALMDHPNIAKVLDAGATDTGRPYFVMELVRGIKITDYCDEHSLTAPERLGLLIQVCQAIQHAHQKGIIHRDIKPSNILVTVNDGVAVPKVIDFGIAKATQGRLTDQTLFTAFEQFMGTPAYMSPEQAVMTSLDIDTRSDIYSLGVLLYELLTGRTPFDGQELLAAGLEGMRQTIREKEPVRPSTRLRTMQHAELKTAAQRRQIEPLRLIHLVRGDLDWIAMKCLEKDRARRYETANGLAMDIRRHLNHQPVVAAAPSAYYLFAKFALRHRAALATAAGITLALTIGLCFSTSMYIRERAARRVAIEQKRRADDQSAITQTISDFLSRNLVGPSSEMSPFDSGFWPNAWPSALAELDAAAASIGDKFQDNPLLEAKLRQAIGDAYSGSKLNRPALALPHYERAVALRKRILGPDHSDTLHSMTSLAGALAAAGRHPEAMALNASVLQLIQAKFGSDHEETISFMVSVAYAYQQQDELPAAIELFEQVISLTKTRTAGDGGWLMMVMRRLAAAYEKRQEPAKAEAILRDELALEQQKDGTNSTVTSAVLSELGECLLRQRKYQEAEREFDQCLAIQEEARPDRWSTFKTRTLLGDCLLGQKRYSEAEPFLLSGYAGLKRRENEMPIDKKDLLRKSLERLVRLYTEWDKAAQAAVWNNALDDFEKGTRQAQPTAK